ncbi:hypothetical protein N7456_013610 [Penicillium angulare]|uniref:Uncharacterized protein n=1 Tax=Penicillium angulare TaxID=116970 RepID=A0A9W9EFR1_9EURO|nr:hypothetical protein N7456_013610 [Penicillium angulare]
MSEPPRLVNVRTSQLVPSPGFNDPKPYDLERMTSILAQEIGDNQAFVDDWAPIGQEDARPRVHRTSTSRPLENGLRAQRQQQHGNRQAQNGIKIKPRHQRRGLAFCSKLRVLWGVAEVGCGWGGFACV